MNKTYIIDKVHHKKDWMFQGYFNDLIKEPDNLLFATQNIDPKTLREDRPDLNVGLRYLDS